jgi:hypothetical protein
MFFHVSPIAPGQFPTASTPQTYAILVRCEAASMRPATTCCGSRPPRRSRFRPIASGRRQSDAERGIGSDSTLNIERGVGMNEILNVEGGVGGKCRLMNRAEGRRSGLKGRDNVSDGAREHRPDEREKAPRRRHRRH